MTKTEAKKIQTLIATYPDGTRRMLDIDCSIEDDFRQIHSAAVITTQVMDSRAEYNVAFNAMADERRETERRDACTAVKKSRTLGRRAPREGLDDYTKNS